MDIELHERIEKLERICEETLKATNKVRADVNAFNQRLDLIVEALPIAGPKDHLRQA